MYSQRIKILVFLCCLMSIIPAARLAQMQLIPDPAVFQRIEDLKQGKGSHHLMQTLRGKIIDREDRILAAEEAVFRLYVSYDLTQYVDSRVTRANDLKANQAKDAAARRAALKKADGLRERRHGDLRFLLDKCEQYGISPAQIEEVIRTQNDAIWDLRMLQVWKAKCSDTELYQANRLRIGSVKPSRARLDLETRIRDEDTRLLLINGVDITEMHDPWPVLELSTDQDVLAAQLEFLDIEHIAIAPEPVRRYFYGQVAAQTLGWVGPVIERNKSLFEKDVLREYHSSDLCGRFDGIEYAAEALLRGRRGEERRDLDGNLIGLIDPELGRDVQLTLDIELQRDIENYILYEHPHEDCCRDTGKAAVVVDIDSGDILALVSLPTFDLTTVRSDYNWLQDPNNPGTPLINRTLNKHYPPGSVAKPLICVAGLESQAITPEESIGCPLRPAPILPNCWIFNDSKGRSCHDQYWTDNNARNALKGSCNIYFSQLAERIEPRVLQKWLFDFGYGRQVPLFPPALHPPGLAQGAQRTIRQASGLISAQRPDSQPVTAFDQIPSMRKDHRRLAGIGQGEVFVTPLQVANSMATLARHGRALTPRLFLKPVDPAPRETLDLRISEVTLRTVLDGLNAVVHERHGTAHEAFKESGFKADQVHVYGKTGSTEGPENAWFAGFAKDYTDRGVAIAVVVEGGQSGSRNAAPLGREIIRFCIRHGYVGLQSASADASQRNVQPRDSR